MLQADHELVTALAKQDKPALEKLLDADFSCTRSDGKTENRVQVLESVPQTAVRDESTAQMKHYIYGEIGDVQANLGRVHTLRVWVKRSAG